MKTLKTEKSNNIVFKPITRKITNALTNLLRRKKNEHIIE